MSSIFFDQQTTFTVLSKEAYISTRKQIVSCYSGMSLNDIKWGKEGGRNWEIRIDIYTLLFVKQITNENLLYCTENSTQ